MRSIFLCFSYFCVSATLYGGVSAGGVGAKVQKKMFHVSPEMMNRIEEEAYRYGSVRILDHKKPLRLERIQVNGDLRELHLENEVKIREQK